MQEEVTLTKLHYAAVFVFHYATEFVFKPLVLYPSHVVPRYCKFFLLLLIKEI